MGHVAVVPRDVLHALLEPKIRNEDTQDLAIIRVKCVDQNDARRVEAIVELIDSYDTKTGFKAMERVTGWHASIVAILAASGKIARGAVPIELAVPGATMKKEAQKRGLHIATRVVSNAIGKINRG